MSTATGCGPEVAGPDWRRTVQVVTTGHAHERGRGSGYLVTAGVVLTAAHVVHGATAVRVRFLAEGGAMRELTAEVIRIDAESDIALLKVADGSGSAGPRAAEITPVRFAGVMRPVDCEALGFPRFKLRHDRKAPGLGDPDHFRDSHHARGTTTPLSNLLSGQLEITVRPPEYDDDPGRSPWEGMSGAAVWSGGCVIGVITEHHRTDGLGRLTASPVDRWYGRLTPEQVQEFGALIALPADAAPFEQPPPPEGPPGLREAAEYLASTVAGQWQEEEGRRRVNDPFPLKVRFRASAGVPAARGTGIHRDRPETVPSPPALTGELDEIVEVYASIPSRRLVVLGAAGSGKTVLTLRFVLGWLDRRKRGDPVPVIFGLGAWDPTADSLRDWMCGQLVRDYQGLAAHYAHGRDLAGALVDEGRILPVLDGFDEIADGLQAAALQGLNAANLALLLTSRPDEYKKAVTRTRVLTGAAVITLDDLTLSDLDAYLPYASRQGADSDAQSTVWDPVLAALREQPDSRGSRNVAAALSTPLMVAMARTVYSDTPGHDPAQLLMTTQFATSEAVQEHLLAAFVPAAYNRPPVRVVDGSRPREWNHERAQYWLGYLAAHLDRLSEQHLDKGVKHDLAWWELGTAMRRSSRMLVVGFLSALAFGVTTAVGNIPVDLVVTSRGIGFILERSLVVGLLHGLVVGLVFGTLYGVVSREAVEPSRVRIQIFGRDRKRKTRFVPRLKIGIGIGSLTAVVIALNDRFVVGPLGFADGPNGSFLTTLLFVAEAGIGSGLAMGLTAWLETPIDIASAISTADLLSTNRRNVIVQMLMWLVGLGFAAGVANGLSGASNGTLTGPLLGLLTGLVFGLVGAFGCGLGYGLSLTAWGQWVALSRIWLPLTGRLPWALIAFLDDACRRGVLRQAGAVYQFRHAQLQEHLTRAFRARVR